MHVLPAQRQSGQGVNRLTISLNHKDTKVHEEVLSLGVTPYAVTTSGVTVLAATARRKSGSHWAGSAHLEFPQRRSPVQVECATGVCRQLSSQPPLLPNL